MTPIEAKRLLRRAVRQKNRRLKRLKYLHQNRTTQDFVARELEKIAELAENIGRLKLYLAQKGYSVTPDGICSKSP